jgi:hypothetical protein
MTFVRQQIERGGERLWRLERLSKGVYYSTRQTTFGKSRPNPAAIQRLVSRRKSVFPSGIAAANLLGFTTQTASRSEVSTSALSLPRKLVGSDTSFIRADRKHGPASPRAMRRCSISCAAPEGQANSRRKKLSAALSSFCRRKDALSEWFRLQLPSPHASAR